MTTILFLLFVLLQIWDALTTYMALYRGTGTEGNPVMAWLFQRIGVIPSFMLMKSIFVAGVFFILPHPSAHIALIILCCVYAGIVINNMRVLLSQATAR